MSRNQRIALVVAALVVAVVAFALARPDDDDGGDERAARTAPAETRTERDGGTRPTRTQPRERPGPEITRIRLRGGTVVGGPKRVRATTGDAVRIVVDADAPDEIHLHGYDLYENAAPGRPARFIFRADIEGVFEIESHVAEDAGKDPLIGRLVVEPA
jgi:hypothetical protein